MSNDSCPASSGIPSVAPVPHNDGSAASNVSTRSHDAPDPFDVPQPTTIVTVDDVEAPSPWRLTHTLAELTGESLNAQDTRGSGLEAWRKLARRPENEHSSVESSPVRSECEVIGQRVADMTAKGKDEESSSRWTCAVVDGQCDNTTKRTCFKLAVKSKSTRWTWMQPCQQPEVPSRRTSDGTDRTRQRQVKFKMKGHDSCPMSPQIDCSDAWAPLRIENAPQK